MMRKKIVHFDKNYLFYSIDIYSELRHNIFLFYLLFFF